MVQKRRGTRGTRKNDARRNVLHLLLQGAGLAAVLTVAYWLARLAHSSEAVRMTVASYGYIGIFVVSFISGLNLVVPVPAVAFMPVFIEAGFSFFVSAAVMAAGMTVADSVAYGFGVLSRKAYSAAKGNGPAVRRIMRFRKHHKHGPLLALLVYASVAPLPNELLVIPMGVLGYRLRIIMPIVFVGNIMFNYLYASGIIRLFDLV